MEEKEEEEEEKGEGGGVGEGRRRSRRREEEEGEGGRGGGGRETLLLPSVLRRFFLRAGVGLQPRDKARISPSALHLTPTTHCRASGGVCDLPY